MEEFKEFQGKSLDEAIQDACSYFDAPREKLEIEIVQDAKNGIFGLVGARKAMIRVRRALLRSRISQILESEGSSSKRRAEPRAEPKASLRRDENEKPPRPRRRDPQETLPGTVAPEALHLAPSVDEDSIGNRVRSEPVADDGIGNRIIPDFEVEDDAIGNKIPPEPDLEDDAIGNRVFSNERGTRRPGQRAERLPVTEPGWSPSGPRLSPRRPDSNTAERPEFRRSPRERFDQDRPKESRTDLAPRTDLPPREDDPRRAVRRFEETRKPFERQPRPFVERPAPRSAMRPESSDEPYEGVPAIPFSELDHAKLAECTQLVVSKIINSILGETPITVTLLENRIDVRVDCGEDSGLLIGREGQTLAALQYIVSRMVSRMMEAPVRVQFDVGDYRERQDDRLRDLAFMLADRVRATGRPCSTRPMSSYHRRLVHMALQEDPDVQTRSSGEGPLKRVIIQRRRPERNS